jgi:hypothetical protein
LTRLTLILSLLLTLFANLTPFLTLQVLRGGDVLEYDLQLDPLQTLVPVHKYDQLPSYFIYAGGENNDTPRKGLRCLSFGLQSH